jgi:hypothetical protein
MVSNETIRYRSIPPPAYQPCKEPTTFSPKKPCTNPTEGLKRFHQDGTARRAKTKGKLKMPRAETFVTFIFPIIFFGALPAIVTVFLIAERFNRYYNP